MAVQIVCDPIVWISNGYVSNKGPYRVRYAFVHSFEIFGDFVSSRDGVASIVV